MPMKISLKPDTHTEGIGVDAAGISVKVFSQYPGRSVYMRYATTTRRKLNV